MIDDNDNDTSLLSLDDSFAAITSTPHAIRTKPNRGKATQQTNLFKVPQVQVRPQAKKKVAKSKKFKPKLVCKFCDKVYVCAGYFKNHTRNHSIQASSERYPNKSKILENIKDITQSALDAVIKSPPGGLVNEYGQEFKQTVGVCQHFQTFCKKVCDIFCAGVCSTKFLLPSKLLDSVVKQSDVLTSDLTLRSELINYLSLSRSEPSSQEVLNFFYCEFVLSFGEALLQFIAMSIHEGGAKRKDQFQCDDEDRQTIHYLAGAILRGFYKRSKRYPNSRVWKAVKETIVHRMAANADVESCSNDDQSWTKVKDRGALIYVGDSCLEFFVSLAEIVESSEEPNGSILFMNVYEKVCKSMGATVYWDGMVGDSLTEEVSLLFLRSLVKSFCQTYGKGVSKRRLNAIREMPEALVPLRHSLASRTRK